MGQEGKTSADSGHELTSSEAIVFGWVAPLLGREGVLRQPLGNREGFLNCLKQLYRRLKGYTLWLYVDRARWHRGEEVDIFLRGHRRLRLRYLPCYQPGLNLQERIYLC